MKIEISITREQGAQNFLTETTCAKACTITDTTLLQTSEEMNRIMDIFCAASRYILQYSNTVIFLEVYVDNYPVILERNKNCVKQAPHLWRNVLEFIYELEASICPKSHSHSL